MSVRKRLKRVDFDDFLILDTYIRSPTVLSVKYLIMLKLLPSIILVLFVTNLHAQEWLVNFEEAKQLAKDEGKRIILSFQGSDWCAPCMKLEKEVWENDEFKTQAEKDYILLKADFPRRRANKLTKDQEKHNASLADRYNKQGFFPLVVILDAEGNVLGKSGYEKKPVSEYLSIFKSFQ